MITAHAGSRTGKRKLMIMNHTPRTLSPNNAPELLSPIGDWSGEIIRDTSLRLAQFMARVQTVESLAKAVQRVEQYVVGTSAQPDDYEPIITDDEYDGLPALTIGSVGKESHARSTSRVFHSKTCERHNRTGCKTCKRYALNKIACKVCHAMQCDHKVNGRIVVRKYTTRKGLRLAIPTPDIAHYLTPYDEMAEEYDGSTAYDMTSRLQFYVNDLPIC